MGGMGGKIFVNYRRDDCAANALAIASYLEREFGANRVFIDLDRLRPGQNFPEELEKRLSACKVVLCLIGPSWLDARNEEGRRRIDDAEDWVRLEIERALDRGLVVVPVLVGGAVLPKASDLPEPLKQLIQRQAATITTNGFRTDMGGLTRDIRAIAGGPPWGKIGIAAGALALAAGLVFTLQRQPAIPDRGAQGGRTHQTGPANAGTVETAKQDNSPNALANAHANAGLQHYRNHAYEAAIAEFSRAIELESRHAHYYKLRGDAYKAQGRIHRAFTDYVRARQLRHRERLGYGQ
jgi:tetratricopeptide (TPR) repeat protein